jgi:hypothetical protein
MVGWIEKYKVIERQNRELREDILSDIEACETMSEVKAMVKLKRGKAL